MTGVDNDAAMELLKRADGHVKAAIVMQKKNVDLARARGMIEKAGGRLKVAMAE